jgi:hypothetical protein
MALLLIRHSTREIEKKKERIKVQTRDNIQRHKCTIGSLKRRNQVT